MGFRPSCTTVSSSPLSSGSTRRGFGGSSVVPVRVADRAREDAGCGVGAEGIVTADRRLVRRGAAAVETVGAGTAGAPSSVGSNGTSRRPPPAAGVPLALALAARVGVAADAAAEAGAEAADGAALAATEGAAEAATDGAAEATGALLAAGAALGAALATGALVGVALAPQAASSESAPRASPPVRSLRRVNDDECVARDIGLDPPYW